MSKITYATILDYLSPKNKEKNSNFISFNKRNVLTKYDDFTEDVKIYFSKSFYKLGVIQYDGNKNNVSYLSAFLSLIDNKFISYSEEEQGILISQFNDYLKTSSKKFLM